jgi:hypothetical protein
MHDESMGLPQTSFIQAPRKQSIHQQAPNKPVFSQRAAEDLLE